MNKEELLKTFDELEKSGYNKNFKMEDLDEILSKEPLGLPKYFHKTIEKRYCGEWSGYRAINQVLFKLYSLEYYRDRVSENSLYSLEPVIMYSRNTDERIDLTLSYPERSIEEIEEIAEKFGKWCDANIRETDEE